MPETKTVRLDPQQIAEQATERAQQLVDVTLDHSGYEPTDDERRLVKLGVDLGIIAYVSELRAHTLASQV